MLKSERPIKLILRGLPTSTELEAVKKEIESEGFKIHKISRLTKFQSKAPMPLIYIKLINDLNADSINNYVDMFGTLVAFEHVRSNSTRAQLSPNAHSLTFNFNVQSLSIYFWNANGLRPKICEVRDFVSEQYPDLLLVQETKLQPGLDPLIANYRPHKDDKNNFPRSRIDGGTAFCCKNNYDHKRVPLPTLQHMDATAIEIKLNNFPPIRIVSANRIRKFWQRTRDPAVKSEFRTLSREVIKDIRHFFQSRWESHIAALTPETGTLWRKISLFKKPPQNIPPLKGALDSVANHPLEKAEVIADSLQKQFEPNTEAENDRFTARTQRKIKRFLDAPTCLDLEKTIPGEVQEYIKKLKINKSPGLDLITNRILKNLPLKFVLFIVMVFNLLMENCHFPKNWKTAVVVPILKPKIPMILNLKITVQSRYSVA
ncbi:RNA-directed DNA polymerase from mobile element jockey [Trichonephila clavipes]|nr:RNA-directed DNA polymerase from mobile element jockey [Trichonephila clavipes]